VTELKSIGLSRLARAYHDRKMDPPPSMGHHHPSSISRDDFCPVLAFFYRMADDEVCGTDPNRIGAAMEFKRQIANARRFKANLKQEFIIGDEIHRLVQFLLGAIGKLWGVWKCPVCKAKTKGEGYMPRTRFPDKEGKLMMDAAPCPKCNGRNRGLRIPWLYVEPSIKGTSIGEALRINGKVDGELRHVVGDTMHRLIAEIKSINDYGWSEGKQPRWEDVALDLGWTPPPGWRPAHPSPYRVLPKTEHVSQATIYAVCKGIRHICFIYVNKNQVASWKERIVPITQESWDLAQCRIAAVEQGVAEGRPPLHARICTDPRDQIARKCPAAVMCFGRVAPHNSMEKR